MDPQTPNTPPQDTQPQPPSEQPYAQPIAAPTQEQFAQAPITLSPPTPARDPGKTLGIVGFVMAFVFLHLIGLILSIVALSKSKAAGYKNTLAFVGIILNSIFMVIGAGLIILTVITLVSYTGITARANTSTAKSAASQVIKTTELIAAEEGAYPTQFSQVKALLSNDQISAGPKLFAGDPPSPYVIEFSTCGALGNKVGYWDYENKELMYVYSGNADVSSNCTVAN